MKNAQILTATDFYKTDHRRQYPPLTTMVYSNLTARKSLIPGVEGTVFFGLQGFIQEFLIDWFNDSFFKAEKTEAIRRYKRRLDNALGKDAISMEHIEALYDLGYLPILIKAVKEGAVVPLRIPMLTMRNTKPEFFWLTNFLESILSCELWKPITSATLSHQYKKIINRYADETAGNRDFVQWQGHDFSFRGMSGIYDAMKSGSGHLLSFTGTDTIPAIDYLETFYGADSDKELIGASVSATEHSVMCLGQKDSEIATFKRLITEIYPKGIISIVSDTWDYWKVLTEYAAELKDIILTREGKVVFRPDSGDPVKIICGDSDAQIGSPKYKGSVEVLAEIFGTTNTEKGYKTLNLHVGLIYGDSITLARAEEILKRLKEKGFSSENIVFGIGSYTYQYVTRDTFGMAVKSTYGEVGGKGINIFKDPKTDDGTKKSAKGLLRVNSDFTLCQECSWVEESGGILEPVFMDGKFLRVTTLSSIREELNK